MDIVVFPSKSWKVFVLKQTRLNIIKFAVTNQRCTLFCLYRRADGPTYFVISLLQLLRIRTKKLTAF